MQASLIIVGALVVVACTDGSEDSNGNPIGPGTSPTTPPDSVSTSITAGTIESDGSLADCIVGEWVLDTDAFERLMFDRYGQGALVYQVVSGTGELSIQPEGKLTVMYDDLTISVDIPADPDSVENPTMYGEISGELTRSYQVAELGFSTGEIEDSAIEFTGRGGWDPVDNRLPFFPQGFALGSISIPNYTQAGVDEWVILCDDGSLIMEPIRTIEGFTPLDLQPTTWSRR